MNINVEGKIYKVYVPSARNPFALLQKDNGVYVIAGIYPEAPEKLLPKFISVWNDVLKERDKQPPKHSAYWTVSENSVKIKQWKIPSSLNPDEKYIVKCIDGFWTCQCKGYAYRGMCNHIKKVKDLYYFLKPIANNKII